MAHTGQWKVDVFLFEGDAEVTAEAVLHADAARPVVGRGTTRLSTNAMVPEIGAGGAGSQALVDRSADCDRLVVGSWPRRASAAWCSAR